MIEYIDLQTVAEFVKDKVVHVVGNARSIFDHKDGEEIDSGDVVIRMNLGLPVHEKLAMSDSIGKRTHILAGCCFPPGGDWLAAGRPIIWYRTLNQTKPNYHGARYFNYLGFWEQIERDNMARASTGCRVLEILRRQLLPYVFPKKIVVFGMDHFQSPTWYRGGDSTTPHDGHSEQIFINFVLGFTRLGSVLVWSTPNTPS